MKVMIEVPGIMSCSADGCAYNRDNECHACAITVGGTNDHRCDTMFPSSGHASRRQMGGVGACKATDCKLNDDCECLADGIEVGQRSDGVDCLTYVAR
jgi:hypothetical protein